MVRGVRLAAGKQSTAELPNRDIPLHFRGEGLTALDEQGTSLKRSKRIGWLPPNRAWSNLSQYVESQGNG
jgi:hypothetical protein